jgi:fructose-1,6-bisphosphatase I
MQEPISATTLNQHIVASMPPRARGVFTRIMMEIQYCAHMLATMIKSGGLSGQILGLTGDINIQQEEVKRLDDLANRILMTRLKNSNLFAALASEELENVLLGNPEADYVIALDPLDGSSNIDVNVSIGTIFSIKRRITEEGSAKDFLQPGKAQVCAGYVVYSSRTELVIATPGNGVYLFVLDPMTGQFVLDRRLEPRKDAKYYSLNEAYWDNFDENVQDWVRWLRSEPTPITSKSRSARYIGSLVADFHRNLLEGGVFAYPHQKGKRSGKLRLIYEAQPMALIQTCLSGKASTGWDDVMELVPTEVHQRVPLIIGTTPEVEKYEEFVARGAKA